MFSASELRIDPRAASAQIASWLASSPNVECCFGTAVVDVHNRTVRASDDRAWRASRVVICSGSDLQTLYPQVFAASGLMLCKLRMLRSVAQPSPNQSSPHLASGLTLRHYAAFRECPSLPALRSRVQKETPELDRFGIHVMAAQTRAGEVILGDSHEYGDKVTPFDKTEIDDLILREARKVFRLNDWSISERWNGVYAKHPDLPVYEAMPEPDVHLCVGTGGAGMTMAFGLAERAWKRWPGET
jgi:FAD dependent oxidoreductase TIGR03364